MRTMDCRHTATRQTEQKMCPNPILTLGDIKIYMYGLMIAAGILCCFWVLFNYSKILAIPARYVDFIFYDGIASIVIGFIGSAVWQGIFNYIEDLKTNPNATFSLSGGITAIGGITVGAVTFIVIALCFRKRFPYVLSKTVIFAPCCITIAHAFGRMGCFFAGCCYGRPVEPGDAFGFLGVIFQPGSTPYNKYGAVPVYPTQLFEAIFLFVLFGVMSWLVVKKNFRYSMTVYLAAYGIWRFLIEFLRADDRGSFVGVLSPSQTLSLGLVLLAVPAFFLTRYFMQKMDEYDSKIEAEPVPDPDIEEIEG